MKRALAIALVCACGGGSGGEPPDASTPAEDLGRDILSMELVVDVSARRATATIQLAGTGSTAASFEVGELTIDRVALPGGEPLLYSVTDGRLDVGVPATGEPVSIEVEYGYEIQDAFDGALDSGVTLLWPYYCGNLFPCHSDPADGLTVTLELAGVPGGDTAVYPAAIPTDAPSYMPAWAIGDYTKIELGTTGAGTEVAVWHLSDGGDAATRGTANLVAAMDWLESTLGPYPFGDRVGSVAAAWGAGALGGMEHHPLWHVATGAMGSQEVHAHEAAHGWYGNGVRIACWEDFVLSEGTVAYLAARALEAAGGTELSDPVWTSYGVRLSRVASTIAWPDSCGEVDIIDDGLFTDAPYMKGAHFFLALENRIGREALDGALASFYAANVGQAAGMQDLLNHIEAETGYDPDACATSWLRATEVPAEETCPAP